MFILKKRVLMDEREVLEGNMRDRFSVGQFILTCQHRGSAVKREMSIFVISFVYVHVYFLSLFVEHCETLPKQFSWHASFISKHLVMYLLTLQIFSNIDKHLGVP